MDAGARGRRLLQRREYKAKVSEFIPKELEDQFSHNQNGQLVYELDLKKTASRIKTGLKNWWNKPIMKPNITKDQHLQKIKNSGGDPSHWANSYKPEGEMIEANSAQQKAMHDAKIKRMEDEKVAKKTKKEEVQLEAKKSCGEGEYYCHDMKKCKPIPDGMKVGKDGMLVKEDMKGMSQKSGDKRSTESGAGMTAKGVAKYNRRTGGNLKTAVTTPPSKLKAGSKAANRRKSFCARSKSWTGPRGKAARRRWNCSYEPELPMIIDEKKKLFNSAPLSDRVAVWSKKITEGDSYVKSDRNKFGLPKDLKSVEKKSITKKTTGVDYNTMMQSYEPQGELVEMGRKGKGAINTDVLKNNPNLDPLKPGDYIKLKRLSSKVDKITERKKLNPNAVFPTVSNVKIKNEIISDSGISNKNSVKKKFPTESKMTPTQKERKEKYVKGMKKAKSGFTKRYGKDGKSVMYATATKMAMKKEETLVEKPGDGYLGPTIGKVGIPNPIRLAKDAVDQMNRANLKKVNTINKISPGTATMPKFKQFNKDTSAAYKNLMQSHKPEGDMVEAKVDQGKDDAAKRNERNQRTFGNRRDSKGGMTHSDDTEARQYNTKKGRGVKMKGKKDKTPVNYHKKDSQARVDSLLKSMKEDFYRKKYDVKDGGYKKTNKMTKSNKRAGDSKAQNRELHIDLKKYKLKKLKTEGSLHKWFKGSKSKDGKGGWVNVVTGGTCASDKPGEGTPKCVSSSKRASMTKAERLSASRRKKKADPGQQSKSGAAKPTYVATDKKKKVDEMNQGPSTPVGNYDGKIMPKFGAGRIGNVRLKGGKSIADLLKKV